MLIHADDLGYGDRSERLPMAHGFDEYFGIPYSNDMNPRVLMHNKEIVGQEATLEVERTLVHGEHEPPSRAQGIDLRSRCACPRHRPLAARDAALL